MYVSVFIHLKMWWSRTLRVGIHIYLGITSSRIGNNLFLAGKFSLSRRYNLLLYGNEYCYSRYYRAGEVIHICTLVGDDSIPFSMYPGIICTFHLICINLNIAQIRNSTVCTYVSTYVCNTYVPTHVTKFIAKYTDTYVHTYVLTWPWISNITLRKDCLHVYPDPCYS